MMSLNPAQNRKPRCERLEPRRLLAITVDTLEDAVDPNDQVTSLREAIQAAEDGELISIPLEGDIRLDPSLGELLIDRPLQIEGPSIGELSVFGADDRVFSIDDGDAGANVDVQISRLTIRDGSTEGNGGGIRNAENLTLLASTITGNDANQGGGIFNEPGARLSIQRSTISDNTAVAGFRSGGGIFNNDGDVLLTDSTVAGNMAPNGDGGGILSVQNSLAELPTLNIDSSTVSGNSAQDSGGGVYLVSGSAEIVNSTISGNSAGDSGGGFYNFNGNATIAYSTITDNEAMTEDDRRTFVPLQSQRGAGAATNGSLDATTTLRGSIVAENRFGGDLMGVGFYQSASSVLVSGGFNLVGDGNILDAMIATDQTGVVDAGLEPLALNEGPTRTHALLEDSSAVDAGDPLALALVGGVPEWDQRQSPYRRVFDGDEDGVERIDIGAYELNWPADVSVTKTMALVVEETAVLVGESFASINVEQRVIFTVTAANASSSRARATGVSVVDTLASGLELIDSTASAGAYENGVWSGFDLAPGESQTLEIEAIIADGESGSSISNVATISAREVDPDESNNEASVELTVNSVDVSIEKSVDDDTPNVDQQLVFTLVATNSIDSNNAATGVVVDDLLPAGLSFVSSDPTEGTYDPSTGEWTGLELDPGESQTLLITAVTDQAAPGDLIDNVASISAVETDPDLDNNESVAALTVNSVNLSIVKVVDDDTPNVGQEIAFTIDVSNSDASNSSATGVVVIDMLPVGLIYVSDDPTEGSYDPSTGQWSGLDLDPGESQTLTVVASTSEAPPGQLIDNVARITADETDPDESNNESSVRLTVNSVDLAINKSSSVSSASPGDTVSFTIDLTNTSITNDTATGIEVFDQLPPGLIFVDAVASAGSYDPLTGEWTGFDLEPGGAATLSIEAVVDSSFDGSELTNMAEASANETDPNLANNVATATVSFVPEADLALTKTADNTSVNVGDDVTFTIVVTNSGPSTATDVVVDDLLPQQFSLASSTTSEGIYNAIAGQWTGLELDTGEAQTLEIVATATSTGIGIENSANAASAVTDPNTGNNEDSVQVTVIAPADLAITKTASSSTVFVGNQVVFSTTVVNNGPSTATGVVVDDLLPPQFSFVSSLSSEGAYSAISGQWTDLELESGEVQTLRIIAMATTGGSDIVNTASVTGADVDPAPGNNVDSVQVDVAEVDLIVGMSVDNETPEVNGRILLTITATNASDAATTPSLVVVMVDEPAGVEFTSGDTRGGPIDTIGDFNLTTNEWTGLVLDPGETRILEISVTVSGPADVPIDIAATATSAQLDANELNNSNSVTITPQVPIGPFIIQPAPGDFDQNGAVDAADLSDPQLGLSTRFGSDLFGGDFLAWQRNMARTGGAPVALRSVSDSDPASTTASAGVEPAAADLASAALEAATSRTKIAEQLTTAQRIHVPLARGDALSTTPRPISIPADLPSRNGSIPQPRPRFTESESDGAAPDDAGQSDEQAIDAALELLAFEL